MSKDNKYNEIEQAVISYGLELLLNSVLKTCIYMLIGIVSGKGLEVACSLVGFICIRKFSGGCHATTNTVCFVLTGGIVLGAASYNKLPKYLIEVWL